MLKKIVEECVKQVSFVGFGQYFWNSKICCFMPYVFRKVKSVILVVPDVTTIFPLVHDIAWE